MIYDSSWWGDLTKSKTFHIVSLYIFNSFMTGCLIMDIVFSSSWMSINYSGTKCMVKQGCVEECNEDEMNRQTESRVTTYLSKLNTDGKTSNRHTERRLWSSQGNQTKPGSSERVLENLKGVSTLTTDVNTMFDSQTIVLTKGKLQLPQDIHENTQNEVK